MSYLISFVRASPSYEEREGSEKFKMKIGFEPTPNGLRNQIQRPRSLGYPIQMIKSAEHFYNIIAFDKI